MSMEIAQCYYENCIHNSCGNCQVAMKISINFKGSCNYKEEK